jgi:hypothetical protein
MGMYDGFIKKLRDDLIEYIDNPIDANLEKINQKIPLYQLERCLSVGIGVPGDFSTGHPEVDRWDESEKVMDQCMLLEFELNNKIFKKYGEYNLPKNENMSEEDYACAWKALRETESYKISEKVKSIVSGFLHPSKETWDLVEKLASQKGYDLNL